MSFTFNNFGRLFIRETPTEQFEYFSNAQLSGISKSYGEPTNIFVPSEITINGYDIVAQVDAGDNSWSASLQVYLNEGTRSQLLKLAERHCAFDLLVEYGSCKIPTDHNSFDNGFLLSNCRITNYSTTELTARSPDAKAVIDQTVSLNISNIYEVVKQEFNVASVVSAISAYAIHHLSSVPVNNCVEDNCSGDAALLFYQYLPSGARRVIYRPDDVNYYVSNLTGIATTSPSARPAGLVFSDGTTVYAINNSNVTTSQIMTTSLAALIAGTATWTTVGSYAGNFAVNYRQVNNLVYLARGTSSSNANIVILNMATGSITNIPVSSATVGFYGVALGSKEVLIYGTGFFAKYKNSTVIDMSAYLPLAGVKITSVNAYNERQYVINVNGSIYSSNDGGYSWKSIGSGPSFLTTYFLNHDVGTGVGYDDLLLYQTFDGGKSWGATENNTGTLYGSSITTHDDMFYIGLRNSGNTLGGLAF